MKYGASDREELALWIISSRLQCFWRILRGGETRCVSTKILMIFIYMFESVIFESDILFILIFEIYLTKMQIKSINIFLFKI